MGFPKSRIRQTKDEIRAGEIVSHGLVFPQLKGENSKKNKMITANKGKKP